MALVLNDVNVLGEMIKSILCIVRTTNDARCYSPFDSASSLNSLLRVFRFRHLSLHSVRGGESSACAFRMLSNFTNENGNTLCVRALIMLKEKLIEREQR